MVNRVLAVFCGKPLTDLLKKHEPSASHGGEKLPPTSEGKDPNCAESAVENQEFEQACASIFLLVPTITSFCNR